MKGFVVILSICLGGAFGWWGGSKVGLMTGYLMFVFGSSAGLYLGRRFVRNYLE